MTTFFSRDETAARREAAKTGYTAPRCCSQCRYLDPAAVHYTGHDLPAECRLGCGVHWSQLSKSRPDTCPLPEGKPSPHMFRNLTPHRITVLGSFLTPTGEPASEWYIEPDPAGPARVEVTAEPSGHHAGIPIATPTYGEVTGLPAPADETLLIVSKMVADACPERNDLVWPGDPVRDGAGRVIGCRALHQHGASGIPSAGSLRRLWDVLRAAYGVDDPEHLAEVAVAARETRMRGLEALCRVLGHHPAKCPPVEEMAAELEQQAAAGQSEPCARCCSAAGCGQTAEQADACAAVISQERADMDDVRLCAEAAGQKLPTIELPTIELPTIELPGLDAALEDRRAAEQQVIRMACRLVDNPDRAHVTTPGLAGAVEKLRGRGLWAREPERRES